MAKALVRAGADPNARTGEGVTPLRSTAGSGATPRIVTLLIDAGAEPNARDRKGRTPLHVAACFGKAVPAVAQALLAAGAEPATREENEETLRDIVRILRTGERTFSGALRMNGVHSR